MSTTKVTFFRAAARIKSIIFTALPGELYKCARIVPEGRDFVTGSCLNAVWHVLPTKRNIVPLASIKQCNQVNQSKKKLSLPNEILLGGIFMKSKNKLTTTLFSVYMLLLIGIILFKLPFYSPEISDGTRAINLIPFKGSFDENGNFILNEVIQNILVFIPFGIYICILKDEWSFKKK